MQIFVLKNGADCVEEGFGRKELPDLIADPTNVVWVDLHGETPEHIEEAKEVLENVFKFHYLTIEDCIETRNQPKVEAFPDYLYFIVHGIRPGETGPANFTTKELDGYLGANYVVTFHAERFRSIKKVKQRILSSPFTFSRGAAYILHNILDELVDLYMPVVDAYDEMIHEMSERVLELKKGQNEMLIEIMKLRRSVIRLRRISGRQLEALYRLSHGEFPQIPDQILPFYRDVHDHLVRISDLAENYRDLVSSLFEIHFSVISTRTNDVMKTLAVVSAIILPLSLIAGIYGMNFDFMPELKTRYGYFATLGGMALLAIGLIVYFWKIGWIFAKDYEPPKDLSIAPDRKDDEDV
ncbi:MAG TPA: magnesium/cobalt transporter CorA [Pyrinomonadaceae bacterium]|nr:magnesium/cobalt transporter CorA [Pyrinomonadaceae bacterium]